MLIVRANPARGYTHFTTGRAADGDSRVYSRTNVPVYAAPVWRR